MCSESRMMNKKGKVVMHQKYEVLMHQKIVEIHRAAVDYIIKDAEINGKGYKDIKDDIQHHIDMAKEEITPNQYTAQELYLKTIYCLFETISLGILVHGVTKLLKT